MDELLSSEESSSTRSDTSKDSNDIEEIINLKVNHNCCEHSPCSYTSTKFEEKLKNLEEEHEILNTSLSALTTHFAQVQFRLRQAVAAPQTDKETLLVSLEEFAFRGIPDVGVVRERIDEARVTETVWARRVQQQHLIEKLKTQIRELEHLIKTPESKPLQSKNVENKKINELKSWININLSEDKYFQLTPQDIKQKIETVLNELEAPLTMEEELVTQLKIQIADLERFINYIRENNNSTCTCCAIHPVQKPLKPTETMGVVKRTITLLNMFAILYLGCNRRQLNKKNVNHWGDLRAKLEIAITNVLEAIKGNPRNQLTQGEYNSDSEFSSPVSNVQVTVLVRKYLAICIRDLMLHGTSRGAPIQRLLPFIGCIKQKFKISDTPIHAWEIILKYYRINKGDSFNETPVRKLSQSFNLDIVVGDYSSSNKNTMLSEIGNIIYTHSVYKSSYDSHFKAFICAALNFNKLVTWLQLIFHCRTLVEMYYEPWSYVRKTRFSDSLQSLDALTDLQFDLPVDLAVRRFQNIEDGFI